MIANLFKYAHLICVLLLVGCQCKKGEWQGVCDDPHGIGTIEIEQVKYNALKIYLRVETERDRSAYVQYWEAVDSSKTYYSPVSQGNNIHEIMLVQLKPSTTYKFNIVVQDECCKTLSKTYNLKTKNPTWAPYYKSKRGFTTKIFDGNFHFHSRNNPGHMLIVNDEGDLNWYQKAPFNFKVSKYTKKNTFLAIISADTLKYSSGKEIVEVDLFGQLIRNIKTGDNNIHKIFHHEIGYDINGNLMVLTLEDRIYDLTSVGGTKQDTVRGDGILILDDEGTKIWEWTVFDVMNPIDYENILQEKEDWLHANSLFQDTEGNYLMSFRNLNQIWKINASNGEIDWKLGGEQDDFKLKDELKFYGQHNVRFNKNGEIELLDNDNKHIKKNKENRKNNRSDSFKVKNFKQLSKSERKAQASKKQHQRNIGTDSLQSRLLVLKLDQENKRAELVREVKFPLEYFTKSQGSAEFVNDSIVMFCSTNTKRIIFTNYKGELKEVVPMEFESYRAQYIPELYSTSYVK